MLLVSREELSELTEWTDRTLPTEGNTSSANQDVPRI